MSGAEVGRPPATLPADITNFIGRRREMACGRQTLCSSRLVTLTGVGGVGKTRLALELANRVARSFPDGVCLVELASLRDETLVISQVTTALGLGEVRENPLERICEYVSDKTMLIVLDNCEHLIGSCATLSEKVLKAAPGVRVLATSRQALRIGGEQLLTVPPLTVPDPRAPTTPAACSTSEAVQLFTDRAAAIQPGFAVTADNAAAVSGICQALDGIPLAIELAAVQLRVLPVQTLHERLDHRLQLLTQGSRVALRRHQTLRAAIEWSNELCSPAEQLLWERMAVFTGACELEAIEQVCCGDQINEHTVTYLLAGLIDKSIVTRDFEAQPRYRLLETIKEFGDELLAKSGQQETMRAKHFAYYRHLTQRADVELFSPGQAEWMRRLHDDQPNIRAMLDYAFTSPGHEAEGLEAVASLHMYWVNTGTVREGSLWLKRALDLNPEPSTSKAKALCGGALLLTMLGDFEGARRMIDEGLLLAEKFDDPQLLGHVTMRRGTIKMCLGDTSGAMALLEDSVAQLKAIGDECGAFSGLRHLAMAAMAADDPRAPQFAAECLASAESHGAALSKSWALWICGLSEWRHGDAASAIAITRESLRLKEPLHDRCGIAHALETLAWAAADSGDTKYAARLFGAVHAAWEQVGSFLAECPWFQTFHDPAEQKVRRELGESAFAKLYVEGEQLDKNTIPYALKEGRSRQKPPPPASGTELTRREIEIAELIRQGLSNKAISAHLVIAQRTADTHVENILRKLNFTSRTQIAAWASENLNTTTPEQGRAHGRAAGPPPRT